MAAGATEAMKETADDAANGVLGAAKAKAPEGLVDGARPSVLLPCSTASTHAGT